MLKNATSGIKNKYQMLNQLSYKKEINSKTPPLI